MMMKYMKSKNNFKIIIILIVFKIKVIILIQVPTLNKLNILKIKIYNVKLKNYLKINEEIKLKVRGHRNVVCLSEEQQKKLPVLINIKAKDKKTENLEQMLKSKRPFIDLILILDTSGIIFIFYLDFIEK